VKRIKERVGSTCGKDVYVGEKLYISKQF